MKIIPVTSSPMNDVSAGATVIVTFFDDSQVEKRLIGKVISPTTIGILGFSADWSMGDYERYSSDSYSVSWLLSQGYKILVFQ